MPEKLHRKLAAQVVKSWPQERKNAYIYGTLARIKKAQEKKK